MSDADKAGGENVLQESLDEVRRAEREKLPAAAMLSVAIAEGHPPLGEGHQPLVAEGDAMGIAAQISEHLRRAGGNVDRITVAGLENQPKFREAIFEGAGSMDAQGVESEVVEQAKRMLAADPRIAAMLFECANLPPYAAAIRTALGLPVYDAVTMIGHVHAALSLK